MVTKILALELLWSILTQGARNATYQNRHEPYSFAGSFRAVAGRGFSRPYPGHVFIDKEWSRKEHYRVYLRTNENRRLFSNAWISLDHTRRKIIGFPMEGNQGEFTYLLCAENSKGKVKIRKIRVHVLVDTFMSTHQVVMKLNKGFRNFVSDLNHRILFASYIAEFLEENGISTHMQDVWITAIESRDYRISWVLSTYNKNICSEVLTQRLPRILSSNGKPSNELLKKLNPHFSLDFISIVISSSCPVPIHAKQEHNSNLIMGPILIIIIMLGLSSPIMIAYVIRRGKRGREFSRAGDGRHAYTNGNMTSFHLEHEQHSNIRKSQDDSENKEQYRWSPDLSNRVPVLLPRFPPLRHKLRKSDSHHSSVDSGRSSAWHGLPPEQCAEPQGIQLGSIVQSISQSASMIKSYLVAGSDKEFETTSVPVTVNEGESHSSKSEGIFDTALKKVSSFVNMHPFTTTTLIRISKSDVDDDSINTRISSMDTRNSSFECSIMSSDFPTASQLSSGVNSFDTEAFLSTTASFSQEESFDTSIQYNDTEDNFESFLPEKREHEEQIKIRRGHLNTSRNNSSSVSSYCKSMTSIKSSFSDKNESSFEKDSDQIEPSMQPKKVISRGSLKRMPNLQVFENEMIEDIQLKSDLLHPWYRDQANVRIQPIKGSSMSQYYISKKPKQDNKTTKRKIMQENIIDEICHDEGPDHPTMV